MRRFTAFIAAVLLLSVIVTNVNAAEQVIYKDSKNKENKIALTFDDGPHPYYTYRILEILKKYNIEATFFFVGENVKNYPDAARAVIEAGHEVGNHTFTHHRVRSMNYNEILSEMIKCEDIIFEIDEYKPRLFRPPEGAYGEELEKIAEKMGYSVILWSIDTRDWDHSTPDEIMENVMKNVSSGDIILMHDYIGKNSPTPDALEIIIPALLEKGYEFSTVSELISK